MVQRISEPALVDAIFRLRVTAWATEGVSFPAAPDGRVFDLADAGAEHYGIVEAGRVVAAVRLSYHAAVESLPVSDGCWHSTFNYPVALLSRLVVHPDSRRCGKGSSLAAHVATQAMQSSARTHVAYVTALCVFRALSDCGFSSIGDAIYPWGDQKLDPCIMVRPAAANEAP